MITIVWDPQNKGDSIFIIDKKGKRFCQSSQRKKKRSTNENKESVSYKFVNKLYSRNCVNSVALKGRKTGYTCDILVDAQRTEIPHTHRNIDISLYDREVIADKYSNRFPITN